MAAFAGSCIKESNVPSALVVILASEIRNGVAFHIGLTGEDEDFD